jgi:hypothetical protein
MKVIGPRLSEGVVETHERSRGFDWSSAHIFTLRQHVFIDAFGSGLTASEAGVRRWGARPKWSVMFFSPLLTGHSKYKVLT